MSEFQIVYVPVGVPTFHLESAQKAFEDSVHLLKEIVATENVIVPKEMLLSMESLQAYLEPLLPDLIVFQNVTFANAAYMSEVLRRFSCPIIVWTLREPVIDGGRLRLNSLTGAYAAGNAIRGSGRGAFPYVFGAPGEEKVRKGLKAAIAAARVKWDLRHLRLLSVGHTPDGFGFGRALDMEMQRQFGVVMESMEARELMDRARAFSAEEVKEYLKDAEAKMVGLEQIDEKNRLDFARLYKAYAEYVKEHHIGALSSRCWPDFFTAFGTPVCAVLAMLNDAGIPAGCEADSIGSLSMYIGMKLSGNPVFFGDPVSMDEAENTITYWHCGTAACSLARRDTGAEVGVHCNRKIGPTLDFGCRPCGRVTIFRVGRDADGKFRFFVKAGEALDKPKQFTGTSVVVRVAEPVEQLITESVRAGWEPHFCVIYGDCVEELTMLGEMLGVPVE